jgi:GR25 family glycosyltransferase involved in LPS biosynthesis
MLTICDKIYVINMDADIDRLLQFDTMMSKAHWHYVRFPAINGKHISETLDLRKQYVSTMNFLTDAEIGCMLSHVSIWKLLVSDPALERVAIFEDDARTHMPGTTISDLVTGLYKHLQDTEEPDILYLGKALDDCLNYQHVWERVYISTHPLCLHAYIINKRGAQRMLSYAPYNIGIDMIPIRAIGEQRLKAMVFHPSLYFQDVIGTVSNLRNKTRMLNLTNECLVTQQFIASDTWAFVVVVILGLICAFILCLVYFRI